MGHSWVMSCREHIQRYHSVSSIKINAKLNFNLERMHFVCAVFAECSINTLFEVLFICFRFKYFVLTVITLGRVRSYFFISLFAILKTMFLRKVERPKNTQITLYFMLCKYFVRRVDPEKTDIVKFLFSVMWMFYLIDTNQYEISFISTVHFVNETCQRRDITSHYAYIV